MTLYRVRTRDESGMSTGYEWFTRRAEANACANEHREDVEEIKFRLTKKNVLGLVQHYASHPDNG